MGYKTTEVTREPGTGSEGLFRWGDCGRRVKDDGLKGCCSIEC